MNKVNGKCHHHEMWLVKIDIEGYHFICKKCRKHFKNPMFEFEYTVRGKRV